jgi:HAD superfamily hydrolase (TIGR01509 family)
MTGTTGPAPVTGAGDLAAVLLDMDGTLVDTEPHWFEAEKAIVAEHGGTWTDEQALSMVGSDLLTCARRLRDEGGVRAEPREVVDRLVAHVVERSREEVPWRPGARELLADLRRHGVPTALVTMSWRPLADAVVAGLPAGTFDAVVTGDAVTHGKPHPEPYLTAAALLGVDPTRCVAVEDSVTGAASADAAGCLVLVVPHHVPVDGGSRRVVVPGLEGVGTADLRRWLSDRAGTTGRAGTGAAPR